MFNYQVFLILHFDIEILSGGGAGIHDPTVVPCVLALVPPESRQGRGPCMYCASPTNTAEHNIFP